MSNDAIQVRVGWSFNAQFLVADGGERIVFTKQREAADFIKSTATQDSVVGFNDAAGLLVIRINGDFDLWHLHELCIH